MNYTIIPPCIELKDLVSHFWVGSWEVSTNKPNTDYFVIANSLTEVTFAFNGCDKQSDLLFSLVQGHTNSPRQFPVEGFYHLIGVSFYSYAVPLFFNLAASDLNNEFIRLDTFLGQEGSVLQEKMADANDTNTRIEILSKYLISVLRSKKSKNNSIVDAIKMVKHQNGLVRIDAMADEFCLSQKQFGRRFKEYAGFSPKMYARIIRFESVIKNYSKDISLTEMAYNGGFYDQAHFIHEFKSFTGFSPKEFWRIGEDMI